jgi:hypothetical protein
VDDSGQEVKRFVVPYALVGRFAPPEKDQPLPVAEELWFSSHAFNPRTTKLQEAEKACNAEAAPAISSGVGAVPSSPATT